MISNNFMLQVCSPCCERQWFKVLKVDEVLRLEDCVAPVHVSCGHAAQQLPSDTEVDVMLPAKGQINLSLLVRGNALMPPLTVQP